MKPIFQKKKSYLEVIAFEIAENAYFLTTVSKFNISLKNG